MWLLENRPGKLPLQELVGYYCICPGLTPVANSREAPRVKPVSVYLFAEVVMQVEVLCRHRRPQEHT